LNPTKGLRDVSVKDPLTEIKERQMARGYAEASATVIHRSEPHPVLQGRRSTASASYHVGLDTMMGRRCRHRPEEVTIDGFLLLDTGEYELVTAHVPVEVFWKMKTLDIVGHVRTANRARVARPSASPQVGSVWLVDGELEPPTTEPAGNGDAGKVCDADLQAAGDDVLTRTPTGSAPAADAPIVKMFRLHIHAVHTLDRVAIEPGGPRFIETLRVRDMLPEFQAD
jgi:hypothetical protein